MNRRSGKRRLVPGRASSFLFLFALTGCGTLAGPAPAQGPAPDGKSLPPLPVASPPAPFHRPKSDTDALRVPRTASGPLDPILDSPWARDVGMEEDIAYWLESFQTREADLFRETLTRMGRYLGMVEGEVADRRLPPSLVFLPIVESWYSPTAVSWVGAGGLWQFMAPTARGMGLRVNRLMDERRDPYRATPLALDFLADLYDRFGSWFLALAAYNGGPGRMERVLRRRAPDAERHDGLFLQVRQDLPRETRNFVPRFIAAGIIARDPAAYGFENVASEGPLEFDEVEVPDATSLDVVARAAGVEQREVEALNPQLIRGLTPAGVATRVRIPEGTGEDFIRGYRLIPPEERVTFVEHVVASGETLTHISGYYGFTVDDLRAANPRIRPRLMQIGQRVVVPKAPSARVGLRAQGGAGAGGQPSIYRVQAGDTLSGIAVRYGVRVGDLLRWNELSREAIIRPGDQIRILRGGGGQGGS